MTYREQMEMLKEAVGLYREWLSMKGPVMFPLTLRNVLEQYDALLSVGKCDECDIWFRRKGGWDEPALLCAHCGRPFDAPEPVSPPKVEPLQSQAVMIRTMIRAMGMVAENMQREHLGQSMAYQEDAFNVMMREEGLTEIVNAMKEDE